MKEGSITDSTIRLECKTSYPLLKVIIMSTDYEVQEFVMAKREHTHFGIAGMRIAKQIV
jgi:hypothetical protein